MTGPSSEPFDIEVTLEEDGARIDRVLAERKLGVSRTTLQRWIEEGRVLLDGALPDRRTRVRAGQRVHVSPAPEPASEAVPEDIPLSILFEDASILVVDKPAGMVVHPAAGHRSGTLVNALLHYGGVHAGEDPTRPGIVHRLDKDTSGVLVVARTAKAQESLTAQLKAHSIERRYLAIVLGAPPEHVVYDTLHGRHPKDRKRFSSRVTRGKRACTHIRRLEQLHGSALVSCTLETGRTHQIRVHLSEHRHPILGDSLYGRLPRDPRVRRAAAALGRQALHAATLGFEHPQTGEPVRFESPMPPDLEAALALLRR